MKRTLSDISIMRLTATMAVVFLHTCNTISHNAGLYSLSYVQKNFFVCGCTLMNWAVPLFYMISGALLLDSKKEIGLRSIFTHYIRRLILVLIIFGVPFACMELYMANKHIGIETVLLAFYATIKGESWSHLWYLYTMIGIYATLPMWKHYVLNTDRSTQRFVLVVMVVARLIIPQLNRLLDIKLAFSIPIAEESVLFFLIGKYLRDKMPNLLYKKRILSMILIVIFGVELLICIIFEDGKDYLQYDSPIVALIAIIIFAIYSKLEIPKSMVGYVWKLDRLCFGVYIIHPLFINFMYKYLKITPLCSDKYYFAMVPLFWIGFAFISFVAAWIMNKITLMNKYVL